VIGGNGQVVPALIGIDVERQLISPLHTHDATGIIHIESATQRTFTLGEFFTEWGVRLDGSCIAGYCDSPSQPVRFYVNGQPVTGDPRAIALTAHAEIVIAVGALASVPATYGFPAGY
jgi:hypothetical protein